MLGTQLITGERRLVFIKSWLQMDLRRDRKGECERSVGTGRLGDDRPRAPQGSPRACRATEPHAWRPQGRGSRPPGWHTESWRCPGWARKREAVACITTAESLPLRADRRVLAPRFIKGRALQDATLASGVWGRSPAEGRREAPDRPGLVQGSRPSQSPPCSATHTHARSGSSGQGLRTTGYQPSTSTPEAHGAGDPATEAWSLRGPPGPRQPV